MARICRYLARGIGIVALALIIACPRGITDSGYTLTLSPGAANLFVGDSLRFSTTLLDRSGTAVKGPLSWTSDNPGVATIDSTGTVRAVAAGSARVQASSNGAQATAPIVVSIDSGQALSVTPTTATVYLNSSAQLTATMRDRHGNAMSSISKWQSSNPAVSTVDANGLVRGVGLGSATIQATAQGLVAAATITVAPEPQAAVLIGAGDIATCANQNDSATAKIVEAISGTVFVAGDNAYPNGAPSDYANCYNPTWGRFKSRTRPAPGNHDYLTTGAAGYFGYFGAAAGDPTKGYYSYELGPWHIVVINSIVAHGAGSPQEQWLRADLAANQRKCTLAYWHYPRFSSGNTHGSDASMQDIWQALYDNGADVVVSGHEHNYERFAPQTPAGRLDVARGIREFVVGTGGAGNYGFGAPQPNSEVRYNSTPGVIQFTLSGDHYDWRYIPTSGSFNDSGSGSCH